MVVWWPYVCLAFRDCGFTSGGQGSGCVFSEESFPSMLQDNRSCMGEKSTVQLPLDHSFALQK